MPRACARYEDPIYTMTPTDQGGDVGGGREGDGAVPGAGGRLSSRLGPYVSRVALGVALAALISAVSIWVAGRPAPRRVEIVIPTPTPALPVKIHVAGAVMQPGVYTLAPGARIEDAVAAAGLLPNADAHALNLAALLADGARIDVPSQLASAAGSQRKTAAPEAEASPATAVPAAPGLIDLNTATSEQLQQLDGIGPVRAQAIIEYRRLHGPIERVSQLLDIQGIGEKTADSIRGLVVQP